LEPEITRNEFARVQEGEPLMKTKLTALIPCKNERLNICPCIESVRDLADEILVADSGSTDGTLDIVRKMGGCRIIEREYVHSANFKNWAIPQAQHPWVLIVDADERVTPALAKEIRAVLENPPADVDGYWIGRKNHFLGYHIAHCGWESDDVLRLFRRDVGRYRERWVHAEIELPKSRVRRLQNPFDHYTAWNSDEYWRKMNRYASWGALNLRDEGHKFNIFSMVFRAPLRFLQLYILRLGFLDGMPGFHVCAYTAFYTFMKQARLWELHHAKHQPDPEAETPTVSIVPFNMGDSLPERYRTQRAA
jgi:glycosyltransferase involved in cell wall biosynthesis